MKTVMSPCGRYMLTYNEVEPTGYAHLFEYEGSAPRKIKHQMEIPIEFVNTYLEPV